MALKDQYLAFSDLWLKDIDSEFKHFLAGAVSQSEGSTMVDLDMFKAEIERYTALEKKVEAMPDITDIGWLKVNAEPVKGEMHKWARRWICKYTEYLQNDVVDKLNELETFMGSSVEGMKTLCSTKRNGRLGLPSFSNGCSIDGTIWTCGLV